MTDAESAYRASRVLYEANRQRFEERDMSEKKYDRGIETQTYLIALTELLIDKGVFTQEEIDSKVKEMYEDAKEVIQ